MQVPTSRFGTIAIPEDRVINFPKGLLGFGEHRRFCLLEPADEACFFWLQSLDDPDLAFVITDPTLFVGDYNVPIREEQMSGLSLGTLNDAQVFVIVNKVDQVLTGNFQGPLVINTLNKQGEQFVLAEKRWTTRQPLVRLGEQLRPAKSA
jgi:flagellar assembly factor FliW